jgi:hypothetical protein
MLTDTNTHTVCVHVCSAHTGCTIYSVVTVSSLFSTLWKIDALNSEKMLRWKMDNTCVRWCSDKGMDGNREHH